MFAGQLILHDKKTNNIFAQQFFFQCDHPGCMSVLRAAAQKQEQQRMATLEILQVGMWSI